jgi:glycosyltransferase involved in cell wall biosynthesis
MSKMDKKSNNNPMVSIIMPSYNQAEYLSETLDSVLAQSFKDWECLIVDDGSIDNTEEIAKIYCKKDDRFKYIKQENQGPSVARNNGIRNSAGEFILPLDSDDLISKDYLSEAMRVFAENPKIKLVYCEAEFFGEKKGEWDLPEYSYERLLFENMIFCSAFYRRSDYDNTDGYNENMREGLEDWDFWLSFLKKGDIVYKIPQIHFFYRIKNNSRNSISNEITVKKMHKRIFLNHRELYFEFLNPIYSENAIKNLKKHIHILQKEIEFLKVQKNGKIGNLIKKKKKITYLKNGLFFLVLHPEKFIKKRFNNLVKTFRNGK